MANAYNYSNTALATTLAGNISAGATTVSVVATTGFPGSLPYVLAIDYGAVTEELVKVTGVAGLALTVERGFGGTSAQTHSLGAAVRHVWNAVDATDFRTHEDSTAAHGATGAVVGTTNTQTLTNKTFTSPTVNTPTITNPTVTGGGSLAGTFTGTPTFSQAVTFSGSPVFSGTPSFTGQPSFTDGITVTDGAAEVPLTVDGAASQTADLVQIRNSSATKLVYVDSTGLLLAKSGADLTGNAGAVTARQGSGDGAFAVTNGAGSSTYFDVTQSTGTRVYGNLVWLGDSGWTTYTPLWSSTGTAPAIGNGTITGRYKQRGRTVHLTILVRFGTTTTFGGGTYGFSLPSGLPVAAHAETEFGYCGAARGHAAAWYAGTAVVAPNVSSGTIRIYTHNGASEWSPTVPITWAASSSNYINISMTYETDNSA